MSKLKKFKNSKNESIPFLYRDTGNLKFFAVARRGKRVFKRSLETTDLLDAMGKLPEVLREMGAITGDKAPVKLLSEYWKDMVSEKKKAKPATISRINVIWEHHLKDFFGNLRAADIHPKIADEFVQWHDKKKPGVQYVNIYKYLGNLLRYMVRIEVLKRAQVPVLEISEKESKHHKKKKGRYVSGEEYSKIIEHAKTERVKLLIHIGYNLGMRKMEIGKLEKARVLHEGSRYYFALDEGDTKTGLARVVPVPKKLESLLKKQLKDSGDSEFVFPSADGSSHLVPQIIDREWAAAKEAAKIKGRIRFHDLRHTCATNTAKLAINPVLAVTMLGMSLKTYQQVYLNLSGKDLILAADQLADGSKL